MDDDFDPRDRFSAALGYLALPVYYSAILVHRLFGGRDDHQTAAWESRIRYTTFLQGLPAVAAVVAAGVVGFLGWRTSFSSEVRYAQGAQAAMQRKDYPTAEVCYSRLLGIRSDERQYQFGLGSALVEHGDKARGEQLITTLAPDDRVGYPPAHLWKIDRLIQSGGGADSMSRAAVNQAETHLIRLRDDPDVGARVRRSLMQLYLATGRIDLVLDDPALLRAAEESPNTRYVVVQEMAVRGRTAEVELGLTELINRFQADLRENRDNEESRLLLCKSLALRGDLRAAVTTAEEGLKLNPDGKCGELLAELTTARAIQVRTTAGLTDAERAAVYRRAFDLLKRFGRGTAINSLKLSELARLLHDDGEVERQLLKAVDELPAARLQLAEFYAAQKRPTDAEKQRRLILDRFAKLPSDRQDEAGERLTAGAAALGLKQLETAEQIAATAKPNAGLVNLRTSIYITQYDELAAASDADKNDAKRLELLRKAMRNDPWQPAVLQRLLKLSSGAGPAAEEVQKFLLGMIAEGSVPAAAYLMLGTDALVRRNEEEAFRYLENAYRLRPDAADVLNNLAWAYLHSSESQPERALDLATAALRSAPNDPRILDTRFRAYAKLGKWPEALLDLEKCAAGMTGSRDFHLAAAEVYDQMKQPAVANEHRRRAALAKPTDR